MIRRSFQSASVVLIMLSTPACGAPSSGLGDLEGNGACVVLTITAADALDNKIALVESPAGENKTMPGAIDALSRAIASREGHLESADMSLEEARKFYAPQIQELNDKVTRDPALLKSLVQQAAQCKSAP